MKKILLIAVISLLLMHCGISYNICSPYAMMTETTEINTTIGQELLDLQHALDSGVITQEGYDELKLKNIERLVAPIDSTATN